MRKPITFIENRHGFYDVKEFFDRVKFVNNFSKVLPRGYHAFRDTMMYNHKKSILFGTEGHAMALFHLPQDNPLSVIGKDCFIRMEGKVLVAFEDGDIVNYERAYPTDTKPVILHRFNDLGERVDVENFDLTKYSLAGMTEVVKALPVGFNIRYLEKLKGYVYTIHHPLAGRGRPAIFKEVADENSMSKNGWIEVVIMPLADQVYFNAEATT
jgi:hypothetical protein